MENEYSLFNDTYENLLIVKIFNKIKYILNILFKSCGIITIIQGIGYILYNNYTNIIIGLYLICFGIIMAISDINYKYINILNIDNNIPIINKYLGRTLILFFISNICIYTYYIYKWNLFVQWYNSIICILYIFLFIYSNYLNRIKNKIILSLIQIN
jgi:hypothetical protein